ncbi:MAG TPA: carboxypeptidase-like regulatory domain-containing protein [Blastocatellia bacterium]|nr:carboxypeptidase-like regulatory domain-containing protein [Blastocatellia bacterium]
MINRILISTLALVWLPFLAFAAEQGTGTLKGKIENEKGKPIAGAEVRAMRSRDRSLKETKTDEAGSFSFELVPDDYTVSFDAEGYQGGTLVEMQQVEEGKETTVKTIRLSKAGQRTSLIRGAVFDSQGASLPGVHLKLERVPNEDEQKDGKRVKKLSLSYTSNNRGEFAFRVPAARARYQILATLDGYKADKKFVDVNESESVPLSFSLEPVKK